LNFQVKLFDKLFKINIACNAKEKACKPKDIVKVCDEKENDSK